VPTLNVSVVDLTCKLRRAASMDKIKETMLKASKSKQYKGVIKYIDDAAVSSDFIGEAATCVFDAEAGILLNEKFVKLIAWYDNEWGYSCKVVDLIAHMAKVDSE
jgi:glyceraldehyde 3-phosphate dehydrogenase